MWQNFQVYGNRVRAAPNLVLFCDPDSYTDIYGLKSNVRRSRFYDGFTINEEISTLTTSDVALHARKRKILNQCFNEKSIRAASGFVVKHVDRWHQLLVDERTDLTEWSKTIEFSDELEKLTFDIMGDLSFGKSFGLKEPGDNPLKAIPNAIADFMRFQYSVSVDS